MSYFSFELLRSCLSIPSVMFPSLVLKMHSSSRFVNALEIVDCHILRGYRGYSVTCILLKVVSRSPDLLVLCPAVGKNVGEFERDQLRTESADGGHVEKLEILQAEVGELGADDVEDGEDGLQQADGVLGGHAVAQLQLAQVGGLGYGGQHHQVQVTVIETEHRED